MEIINTQSKKQTMDIKSFYNEAFLTNIVLIGFMGSGKTTIGKLLAEELGFHFLDSDVFIAQQQGCSITEIFKNYGENFFRSLEKDFINNASDLKSHIIATGGGMPIFFDINQLGKIIFLDVKFENIKLRLQKDDTRPLFNEKAYQLFQKRQKIYQKKAHIIIDANASTHQVLKSILQSI